MSDQGMLVSEFLALVKNLLKVDYQVERNRFVPHRRVADREHIRNGLLQLIAVQYLIPNILQTQLT